VNQAWWSGDTLYSRSAIAAYVLSGNRSELIGCVCAGNCMPSDATEERFCSSAQELAHQITKTQAYEKISKFNLLSLSIYSTIAETSAAWNLRATRGAIFHGVSWGYSGSLARNNL
jgi:hypothetical protein